MASHIACRPTAGVIGAGIAGLSAAIALRRAGWEVEVYERSQMKHEVGAAIVVMPMAISILDSWGFDFEKAQGVKNQRMTILHAGSQSILSHHEYVDSLGQYGNDAFSFHRVDLHRCLLDLAIRDEAAVKHCGPAIAIKAGIEVKVMDCETGTLTLENGQNLDKDLIVLADGAHSKLFSQFTGQPDPICRLGRSLYRILLNREEVDEVPEAQRFLTSLPNDITGMCCAIDPIDNVFMIAYPCRSGTMLNVALVHDTKKSPTDDPGADKSWQTPSSVSEVLETAHNFHEDLRRMIELAANVDIKIHHCMFRPPLESFVQGKTVVVGDAAHLQMPTHAAGASLAIESAGVLEILMREVVDSPQSFLPTPTAGSPNADAPQTSANPFRGSPNLLDSAASSQQNLVIGVEHSENGSKSPVKALEASELPAVTVTSGTDAHSGTQVKIGDKHHLASADMSNSDRMPVSRTDISTAWFTEGPTTSLSTLSPSTSLTTSRISRYLTLFNSLRMPRCTAFQILANNGFMSQNDPHVVEQIRRHGFDGPLPGPKAGPWSREHREWYFAHDALAEAEKALRVGHDGSTG